MNNCHYCEVLMALPEPDSSDPRTCLDCKPIVENARREFAKELIGDGKWAYDEESDTYTVSAPWLREQAGE